MSKAPRQGKASSGERCQTVFTPPLKLASKVKWRLDSNTHRFSMGSQKVSAAPVR